ncbi:MAG: hypothetical protein J0L64_21290 [Acidobacteria bacterium]|nr:hypothetical protein [Acidobacteriota bacterium]
MSGAKSGKIERLMIFTNRRDASVARYGKGADYGYAVWLSYFREETSNAGCMGEVIRIGDCEALRIRDSKHRIVERVLNHCNPFQVSTGSARARILYLTVNATKDGKNMVPHLYLQAEDPASAQLAAALGVSIARRLHLRDLSVSVRNDTWFVFEERFPVSFPFGPRQEPPPELYFNRHPTIHYRYSAQK